MLATGAALNWKLGVKLGGSALLTYFFRQEMDKHQKAYEKKYARLLTSSLGVVIVTLSPRLIAIALCLRHKMIFVIAKKHLHNRTIAANSIRTTCTTDKLKQDPKCTCIQTNTCFDQKFLNMAEIQGLPPSFTSKVAKPFSDMTRGELTSGALSAAGNANSAAIRNLLRKVDKNLGNKNFNPNSKQKNAIKAMAGSGIPTNLAAALATSPLNSAALAKAKSALRGAGGPINIVRSKGRQSGNVWGFGGKRRSKRRRKRNLANKFAKLNKKRSPSGKVIDFAEKATSRAQINQDKDRAIFEIISRRYQLSAPNRLGLD